METSPPVRDVSERDRANRNKCIVVAVVSVLVLAAIVLVIAYITHFRSTGSSPVFHCYGWISFSFCMFHVVRVFWDGGKFFSGEITIVGSLFWNKRGS